MPSRGWSATAWRWPSSTRWSAPIRRVDPYLDALLARVDRSVVISGIGERPAVVHVEQWGLPGFTTGSGCVAPALSQRVFDACVRRRLRRRPPGARAFLPLEDLRDAWGPARVLHAAVDLAGIAPSGPIPPFVSALGASQLDELAPVAVALHAANLAHASLQAT